MSILEIAADLDQALHEKTINNWEEAFTFKQKSPFLQRKRAFCRLF